jgi:hypothetical protein
MANKDRTKSETNKRLLIRLELWYGEQYNSYRTLNGYVKNRLGSVYFFLRSDPVRDSDWKKKMMWVWSVKWKGFGVVRKIKIYWSCGVRSGCAHRTKLGAWLHHWWHGLGVGKSDPPPAGTDLKRKGWRYR